MSSAITKAKNLTTALKRELRGLGIDPGSSDASQFADAKGLDIVKVVRPSVV